MRAGLGVLFCFSAVCGTLAAAHGGLREKNSTVSPELFVELDELARIVDISYCVGTTNIHKPFRCMGRCDEFPSFELVRAWRTGVLLSDSCGYIALDHNPKNPRIVVAFRGTYSIANTVADLSTIPQEYTPYPGGDEDASACANCTVHSGFLRSWENTRHAIISDVEEAIAKHPAYRLTLVGHSLGGAVALLAGLDFLQRGWRPVLTTFGEPRVGNVAFVRHVDEKMTVDGESLCRRVTHKDDPVPLLPLTEWGYHPHGGELYISSAKLPPKPSDVRVCEGDVDPECLAGADDTLFMLPEAGGVLYDELKAAADQQWWDPQTLRKHLLPSRYRLWQLFFAHRDYFWRLGLCAKTSGPWDWKGKQASDHENELR